MSWLKSILFGGVIDGASPNVTSVTLTSVGGSYIGVGSKFRIYKRT